MSTSPDWPLTSPSRGLAPQLRQTRPPTSPSSGLLRLFSLAARSRPQSASYASLHSPSACQGRRGLISAPPFAPTRRVPPLYPYPEGGRASLAHDTSDTPDRTTGPRSRYAYLSFLPQSIQNCPSLADPQCIATAQPSGPASCTPLPLARPYLPLVSCGSLMSCGSLVSCGSLMSCGSLLADLRSKRLTGLSYSADARHSHR